MDIESIRRAMLVDLIDKKYRGNRAEFARAAKKTTSHIHNLIKGLSPFGERAARSIEKAINIEPFYLDGHIRLDEERISLAAIKMTLTTLQEYQIAKGKFYPTEAYVKIALEYMAILTSKLDKTLGQVSHDETENLKQSVTALLPDL